MADKTISDCAVVIPIYKEDLTRNEETSLRQCLSVLGEYPMVFIAPRKLNCEKYKHICSEYNLLADYELFNDGLFNGVNGYSALMVSDVFYGRFLNYKYILIYQLDAFVFENDLAFWCGQNYDYVGGPFFELRRGADIPKHTTFLNGGFSLRKTNVFYKLAKKKLRLNFFLYLLWSKLDILKGKRQTVFNLLTAAFLFFAVTFLRKIFRLEPNEDFEWSKKIKKYGKIAPFDMALRFSFDSCPEYAFKLTDNSLPFGCHGWPGYYNRLFWNKFIQ